LEVLAGNAAPHYNLNTMTFKRSSDAKGKTVLIRCTEAEKLELQHRAKLANLSLSEFLLRSALRHAITVKTDMHNVLEIRALINTLRDIYNENAVPGDERLQPVLDEAVEALRRIIGRPHQLK
jgi:hypothetical protein